MIVWSRSSSIIFLCCFGLFFASCGKKGPPKPPIQEKLPRVVDLQAVAADAGVRLMWTTESYDNEVAGFMVYRSKPHSETTDCPGCTRDYEVIMSIAAMNGQTRFQILDSYVEPEGSIYYKVIPFDRKDRTGPDSNEARVLSE